ncbi:MAG: transglycosylase SLT domain-containing protein, partial [Perlucidibaca sp.]
APVAWRQMAMAAARGFDPEAESLFARSEPAWWPDSQRELRLRLLVRQGDWAGYLRLYEQLPPALKSARAWLYWQARALQAQGNGAAARKLLTGLGGNDDYYGLLAREALGSGLTALPAKAVVADDGDRERLAQHAGFQRALALYALGQRWESASEWNWAVRTADDHLLRAAIERAVQVGWYDRAIYAAERTETPEPRQLYIAPYRDIAAPYLRDTGLDEAWVYGLMRQESRFAPAARSSSGAGGLMQLMPGTAQWSSNKLGLAWQPERVSEVDQNLRLGTFYLNHVLTELGHPVLATAGYNAGPRRALEWQPAQPLEATRYIESIPYAETRDYVKKVMTNAVQYARVFGQGETRLLARLGTIPAKAATPIEGP